MTLRQVIIFEGIRSKAVLPEVAGPAHAPVGLPDCRHQSGLRRGDRHEVGMVRHQVIRPYRDLMSPALLGQQVEIESIIVVLKKGWLPPILPAASRDAGDSAPPPAQCDQWHYCTAELLIAQDS